MEEIIKKQIDILEEIQNVYKDLEISNKVDICINISEQINKLIKTYLAIKTTTITTEV